MQIKKGTAPGRKIGKRFYLRTLLWFLGRSIQSAAAIDPMIRQEFLALPDQFTFSLTIHPHGPTMVVGKNTDGSVTYFGHAREDHAIDVTLSIHDIEAAMLLLTFREGTAVSAARDRISIYGSIVHGCSIVRVLDRVEILLLPAFLARRAVKRYLSPPKKHSMRIKLYIHSILGH